MKKLPTPKELLELSEEDTIRLLLFIEKVLEDIKLAYERIEP